jgi:hypothetical protein
MSRPSDLMKAGVTSAVLVAAALLGVAGGDLFRQGQVSLRPRTKRYSP